MRGRQPPAVLWGKYFGEVTPPLRSGLCGRVWEVGDSELAVVFFGSFVICLCGGKLVIKRAEVYPSIIELDSSFPFSLNFVPFETFVF